MLHLLLIECTVIVTVTKCMLFSVHLTIEKMQRLLTYVLTYNVQLQSVAVANSAAQIGVWSLGQSRHDSRTI